MYPKPVNILNGLTLKHRKSILKNDFKLFYQETFLTKQIFTKKTATISGVTLILSPPVTGNNKWIGQEEILRQVLACWLIVGKEDLPLSPRILGMPGIGKTTLAMVAAESRKQPLYIFQCTSDTRPEDLLIMPVLAESRKISYHASPLVSAMLTGGICVLDEGNRMNEKSWASLAPLLDHRRYVESIVAGIRISAHQDLRVCVTMNDDQSTFGGLTMGLTLHLHLRIPSNL